MPATVNLAPLAKQRFVDNNGAPLYNGKIFTYAAGTTTKQATYTDSTGTTPAPNPILLDARGEAQIWTDVTLAYKFVAAPSNDTDPPTNPFWTVDNIPAANSLSPASLTTYIASLLSSIGSALVGFIQSGTGAISRPAQAKMRDTFSAKDFGAIGDGSSHLLSTITSLGGVNTTGWSIAQWQTIYPLAQSLVDELDWCAITAALALNTSAVYLPAGTYVVNRTLFLTGAYNGTQLVFTGSTLTGAGIANTTIKASASFLSSYIVFIGNPAYKTTPQYSVGNTLANLTVDDQNLPNDVSHSGIYMQGTYQNVLENLRLGVIQYPFNFWNLNLGRGVAETLIKGVKGQQLQIASDTADRVTTTTLIRTSWTFVNINNALGVNFVGPTIQGTTGVGYQANRVQVSNAYDISFVNGDLEGNGTLYTLTNVNGFISSGNNLGSTVSPQIWPGTTYFSDGGGNARLQFLDNYAYKDDTSFIPALSGAGAPAYTTQIGTYQRIGRRINFQIYLTWTGATVGGNLVVTGLPSAATPFANRDTPVNFEASGVVLGAGQIPQPFIPQGSSQINFGLLSQTAGTTSIATIPAVGTLNVTGSYLSATY